MTESVCRVTEFFTVWELPDGRRHREDGPAFERNDGFKEWYQFGKLHREDGPAKLWPQNHTSSWYLEGEYVAPSMVLIMDASKYPKLQVYQIMHS